MTTATNSLTPEPNTPSPTVLVVEDDVLARMAIAEYLRECGYRVYEAANSDEAVELLQFPRASFDVVLSDVRIPGAMDGFGLARWIRAHQPRTQVILSSSFSRSADVAASLCESGPLFRKPYEPESLVDRIKQLIAKAGR